MPQGRRSMTSSTPRGHAAGFDDRSGIGPDVAVDA
jgi:hypothetical protein